MLAAVADDVRAGHVVAAVEEERGQVLAVGEAEHGVHRPACVLGVGDGRLGEAQGPARLHEANVVGGDFPQLRLGGMGSVRRAWRDCGNGGGSPLRNAPGRRDPFRFPQRNR